VVGERTSCGRVFGIAVDAGKPEEERIKSMNNQNDNHADHYQQIVEDMPTGVALCKMIFDTSGKPIDFIYLKVNKAYGELTGLRNVIGKKVTEILPNVWQSDTELFEIYGRVALSGIPEHFERYIERLKSWLNISVYSPEKEHFVIMVENITGRKQTEEALRLRESYLSAIIENQPGLLWMKNRDGKFLAVNTEFSISSGMENPEMLVGKTDFDIWPQDLAARYVADDDRVMQSGKPCMVEEPISVEGTMQWFETFKAPIFDKQGTVIGTTGFSRDITERKKPNRCY
jgi:PAS domain S-box-containing protein